MMLPALKNIPCYQGEHHMVRMSAGRQVTSFLRPGHLFVACEPRHRHPIRRCAQTHLEQGLVSLYKGSVGVIK